MLIEIVAAPHGSAPIEVREAWIGIILSAGVVFNLPPCGCPFEVAEVDNISQARKLGLLDVIPEDLPAFIVPIIPAVQKLAAKNEKAARWWEKRWEKKGRTTNESEVFLFHKDACRVV